MLTAALNYYFGRGYSQVIANIGRLERTEPDLIHFIWGR